MKGNYYVCIYICDDYFFSDRFVFHFNYGRVNTAHCKFYCMHEFSLVL
jgi:hypothetical protein